MVAEQNAHYHNDRSIAVNTFRYVHDDNYAGAFGAQLWFKVKMIVLLIIIINAVILRRNRWCNVEEADH